MTTHQFQPDTILTAEDLNTAFASKIGTDEKGAANGVAPLDASGKVPAANLPSYVDDVLEATNFASLPPVGEGGKIYVTIDNNKTFRWSGSSYIEVSPSPGTTDAVVEGSTNLYFTFQRVRDTVLSGLSTATNAVVSATDTVVQAIGKLQAQIATLIQDQVHAAATKASLVNTDEIAVLDSQSGFSLKKLTFANLKALVGSGATGGGTDAVFYENDQAITADHTIPAGKNAGTFGPVTINNGVTVTVSDGSVWTIV